MRINFTLWSTVLAGGVKAVFEIANGLSERGHDVMITALGGNHDWFPLKVPVNYVKPPKGLSIIKSFLKIGNKKPLRYLDLERFLRKLSLGAPDFIEPLTNAIPDCDINVATWYPTAFAVYRSGKGIPFYFFQDFPELAIAQGNYALQLMRESLFLPLHLITGSNWLKEWLQSECKKEARAIGYGLKHQIFFPGGNILMNVSKPCVMGLFRDAVYKGGEDLSFALSKVSEKISNLTLLAVGERNIINKQCVAIKDKIKIVYFEKPSDEELAKLYRSADVFVFSSHVEGFGLPPLEAMACGTSVVTTDCLGIRDYAIHEKNSLIVSPKEPDLLAEGILRLLNDKVLREELRTNALVIAKKFTWDSVLNKVEEIFKDMISVHEKCNS